MWIMYNSSLKIKDQHLLVFDIKPLCCAFKIIDFKDVSYFFKTLIKNYYAMTWNVRYCSPMIEWIIGQLSPLSLKKKKKKKIVNII